MASGCSCLWRSCGRRLPASNACFHGLGVVVSDDVPGFVPRMLVDPDIGPFRADQRVFTAMLDGWQPYARLNTSQRTEPDGQGAQLARITAYTRLTNNRACQLINLRASPDAMTRRPQYKSLDSWYFVSPDAFQILNQKPKPYNYIWQPMG